MSSRAQLEVLIKKYRENPDDAMMNKIHKVVNDLVNAGEFSPSDGADILADI
ncbi:hypothetical protein QM806_04560 [Rhodococcus sp. IEGM 1351]|uniref:hypothetical protein n=1 Tax=Rhodococcus sp. IEGM 1351 TaxID=3047089 RepID=UPI0024B7D3FE|nr:hypothetical protein [Rhodococcus sp. IEGM 1351]MDI9934727.1 hypothetical protein [Rhodococcus sp. IEGM 1351]